MDKPDEELRREELRRVAKKLAELDWDLISQKMAANAAARAAKDKQKPANGNGAPG